MAGKVVGADPLKVSPILPQDYRCVNGVWIHEPGWWRNIPDPPKFKEKPEPQRRKKRK